MFLHVCFTCGIVLVAAQTFITQLSPGGLPGRGTEYNQSICVGCYVL